MILMYHKVDLTTPTIWWVSADSFDQQMADLAAYEVVSLSDYDPRNPSHVVITFDGVYENVYLYAYPIMKKWEYPFELFVIGDHIGGNNSFDTVEPPARFCTIEQLQEMATGGGRIQWHTKTHRKLVGLDDSSTLSELVPPSSLKALFPPPHLDWFAYPHGEHDLKAVDIVRANFSGALSCVAGDDDDRHQLNRITAYEETRFSKTRVSVIIANFNYGRFLPEAVESVLRQTHKPDEILIIDDCSTDGSAEIIKRYRDLASIEINTSNLGIVDNFNKAVSLTTGDYIAFLGADNRMRSDYVELCKAALDRNSSLSTAYTDMTIFGPLSSQLAAKVGATKIAESRIDGSDIYLWRFGDPTPELEADFERNNFVHGSSMYRRSAFEAVGGYKKTDGPEDHNLFYRMYRAGWGLERVPGPLIEYRQHSNAQANTMLNLQNEVAHFRREALSRDITVQNQSSTISRFEGEVSRLAHEAAALRGRSEQLEQQLASAHERSEQFERQLASAVMAFNGVAAELVRLKASVSWRTSAPLRYAMTRYPGASLCARKGAKLLYWTMTGQVVKRLRASLAYRFSPAAPERVVPASSLAGLDSDGLPIFLGQYLKERWPAANLAPVRQAYRIVADRVGQPIDESSLSSPELTALLGQLRALAAQPDETPAPAVSIIVPVYNALAHTLACLLSLLAQPARHSFEILVADDVSSDMTAGVISAIGGRVRHIRPSKNLGFVRNCNATAKQAGGSIIVLLNNDTIALPGWLDELVAPILEDATIGLTCSKLLNADGTLQEAGGIFWRDGTAWNYGRGADPRAYPFNFVRDTDYGSGAAIAVNSSLWNELGGFDERFAPAYCEDADLAFALRDRGYRTVYIPTAELIHHEGVSHGRDDSAGIKAYQVENLKKLRAKWATALESHFPNGQNVAIAAARSRSKPRALVIDHYVPQWDRDAGSRAMDGYLRFLVQSGFHVTFWPDNQARDERYGQAYQALGIEVAYGWPGQIDFKDWIAQRGADFDYVLLSRPHVALPALQSLKRYTSAKLLYIGHDLHGARLRAERDINPSSELDREIERSDAMESAVWEAVDAIYYPSREEAESVSRQGVTAPARALPLFVFSESNLALLRDPEQLRDSLAPRIIFVGGFRHRPNVDGMLWFCRDIWPLVKEQVPQARLTIAGSDPPLEITLLMSSHVTVTGYINDEELEQLYRNSDAVVAPLRFGAGVKGKVLEALRQGVPLVLTSTAAQGIDEIAEAAIVADEPQAFAAAVVALLTPGPHRASHARRGQDLIRTYYSEQAVRSVLAKDMPELSRSPTDGT